MANNTPYTNESNATGASTSPNGVTTLLNKLDSDNDGVVDGVLATGVTTEHLNADTLVTAAESISSNDNDTTLPTSAAVKDYVDAQILTKDNLDEIAEGTTNVHFTATDNTKLDGIETAATADQTGAQIKTAYEAESDTNAFTDADETKLDGIEASATADQTDAEIRTAVEAATDSNVFTDADHTKLDSIESSADVTDATNVTAAGALMDSELTDLAGVKGVTISTLQSKPSEGAFVDGDKTKLDGVAASANNYAISSDLLDEDNMATDSATKVPSQQSVKAYVDSQVESKDALSELSGTLDDITAGTTNLHFTATDNTKLDGIEASADVTDATNVDAAGAVMTTDTELSSTITASSLTSVGNLTGLAVTGDVTVGDASGNARLELDKADASVATIHLQKAGADDIYLTSDASETFAIGTGNTNRMEITAGGDCQWKNTSGAAKLTWDASDERVGIRSTAPVSALTILGNDSEANGPIITLAGDAVNQGESGRIRFQEAAGNYQGGYIHYDGSANELNLGMHATGDTTIGSDESAISIARDTGLIDLKAGKLKIAGSSGTDGQVLTTGGDGTIAWEDAAGGGGGGSLDNVSEDSTPQLGGDLDVNGNKIVTVSNGDIVLEPNGTGGVGIGTDSPSTSLHVSGAYSSGATPYIRAEDTTSSGALIEFYATQASGAGYIQTGTSTDIRFAPAGSTKMLLEHTTGNLGLGTTAPMRKLDCVYSDSNTDVTSGAGSTNGRGLLILNSDGTDDSYAQLDLRTGSSGDVRLAAVDKGTGSTDLAILTDNAGSFTEKMRILAGGDVGIGTSPNERLEVAGNIKCNAANGKGFVLNSSSTTGIFRQNGDELGITVGGSERMRIDNSGMVGIGTDIDPSRRLTVDSGSTDTVALFKSSGDANAYILIEDGNTTTGPHIGAVTDDLVLRTSNNERMRIDSSGNCGIGCTSTLGVLEVAADDATTAIAISETGTGNKRFAITPLASGGWTTYATASDGGSFVAGITQLGSSVGIGTTAPTLYSASTEGIHVAGTNAELKLETSSSSGWAFIHCKSPESDWAFGIDNDENFRISNNSGLTSNTAITIDTAENVGIGTTAPSAKLEIAAPSSGSAFVANLLDNTADGLVVKQGSNEYLAVNTTNTSEAVVIGNTTTNPETHILGGNVGIGTTSPSYKLHSVADAANWGAYIKNENAAGYGLLVAGGKADGTTDAFQVDNVAGTTLLTLEGSGDLGVGHSSPSSFHNSGNRLVIGAGSGEEGMTIYSGSSSNGVINFADVATTSSYQGRIVYDHSDNAMSFHVGGTGAEVARIDSSGNVGIGGTPSTHPLEIHSADSAVVLADSSAANSFSQFRLNSGDQDWRITSYGESYSGDTDYQSKFSIFGGDSTGTRAHRLVISSGGQISQPVETLTTGDTVDIDFSKSNLQTFALDGNESQTELTGSNYAAGRTVRLMIDMSNDSHMMGITTPSNWTNFGDDPTSISSAGLVLCELTSWTAAEGGVTARWSEATT